jgi:hypothetical protein
MNKLSTKSYPAFLKAGLYGLYNLYPGLPPKATGERNSQLETLPELCEMPGGLSNRKVKKELRNGVKNE